MLRENDGRGATGLGMTTGEHAPTAQPRSDARAQDFRKFRNSVTVAGLAAIVVGLCFASTPITIFAKEATRGASVNHREETGDFFRSNPTVVGAVLKDLAAEIEGSNGSRDIIGLALRDFKRITLVAENFNIPISRADANAIALTFVTLYKRFPDNLPGSRSFLADFVIRHADSPESKGFVKSLIDSGATEERRRAISALSFSQSMRGDAEIARRLVTIYSHQPARDFGALWSAVKISEPIALPTLKKEISKTKDLATFNKLASIASIAKDLSALGLVLRRVPEFPVVHAGGDSSPTIGIYAESLLRFVELAEGEELAVALRVLPRSATARIKSYPVLLAKLKGGRPESRRSTFICLQEIIAAGDFIDAAVLTDLSEVLDAERDSNAAAAGRAAIATLKGRLAK